MFIDVAEAYNIPYFRCFTMPWTPTTAYPHSFAAGGTDLGAVLNELSYNLFDTIMWKATQPQINRWRKKTLGLRSTTLAKLSPEKTPFIYNFSSFVVPRPIDYPDWISEWLYYLRAWSDFADRLSKLQLLRDTFSSRLVPRPVQMAVFQTGPLPRFMRLSKRPKMTESL